MPCLCRLRTGMVIKMPFIIERNDITRMHVDAIVNAANSSLLGGGGVDGAIHRAAGPQLLEECRTLGGCRTGEAKITGGYLLPCRYVIHTVGPIWQGGDRGEKEALVSCYRESLRLAAEKGCGSVAFPLISSGVYGYPKDQAFRVASDTIREFLETHDMEVYLLVFDHRSFVISQNLYADIQSYISDEYMGVDYEERENARRQLDNMPPQFMQAASPPAEKETAKEKKAEKTRTEKDKPPFWRSFLKTKKKPGQDAAKKDQGLLNEMPAAKKPADEQALSDDAPTAFFADAYDDFAEEKAAAPFQGPEKTEAAQPEKDAGLWGETETVSLAPAAGAPMPKLEDYLSQIDEGFREMLLRKIDERHMTDAECYKKANIDRKLFNKIKNQPGYRPGKPTVLALAISLELPMNEIQEMLMKAGFSLSHSSKFDLIIEYFILQGNYDIYEINEALFSFDQKLLGSIA